MKSHAPLVFALRAARPRSPAAAVTFRSIVIPIKAIVLNLLSVGAAYGVLVWIFQEGHLESLLGFESTGAIVSWMPLFLFVVLFGLSMDYHVFILTRIREAFDRGMPTDEAVAHGIKTTAGVVTSAAVVMVAVFAIFATLSLLDLQADGRRAGGRGPDRRDDHPRRAAAGDDEAARRLELVPARAGSSGCRTSPTSPSWSRSSGSPPQPIRANSTASCEQNSVTSSPCSRARSREAVRVGLPGAGVVRVDAVIGAPPRRGRRR